MYIYHNYNILPSRVYLLLLLSYNNKVTILVSLIEGIYPIMKKHFLKGLLIKITAAASSLVLVGSAFGVSASAASYCTINNETGTTSGTVSDITAIWPEAPEVNSSSCILIDADTGSILFERDSHARCYPASTTKILTGLLTIENCNMDDTVTFSQAAANSVNITEDANLGSKAGEQFTVNQLLHGLLLYSANEMAYALGEHVAGSIDAFVDMMNAKAKELGALDTHFANASGLYDPDHYTTAYDMAMIARGCYNNASFVSIDSTSTSYVIPPTNMTSTQRTIRHRHKMLKGREYYYEYCKGGKTGFTDESQNTLVTFAEKDGMRLICVVFKEPDDSIRYVDTRALFDWGFANFQKSTTTGSQLGAMFSNDNYYNSNVFSELSLDFGLNASFITIPNKSSVSNVTMTVDDNYDMINENGVMTTHLKFLYNNNTVGTTTLNISAAGTDTGNLLPYREANVSSQYTPKKCFTINIWIVVGIGAVILFIIYIIEERARRKRQRRHYNRRRRHLR